MDETDRKKRAGTEAAEWFVKLQSGDLPLELRAQFVGWLLESHVHVAELLRMAQIHGALEQFEAWSRISFEGSTHIDPAVIRLPSASASGGREEGSFPGRKTDISRLMAKPRNSGAVRALVAAAALTVLFSVAAIFLPQIRGEIIDTERGERREVVLSDGSIIQVDPETRLRVKYSAQARRVFLERGRALFHVVKNKDRPFLVNADDTTVRAVGTAFGVDRQSQRVIITVAEGKVSVTPSHALSTVGDRERLAKPRDDSQDLWSGSGVRSTKRGGSAGAVVWPTPPHPAGEDQNGDAGNALFLSANQQVAVERTGSAGSVHAVDSYRELAWAQGRLIFHNDDVAKIIAEFNRYNRIQLKVTDAALARRPVSGVFNAAEPEAFIAFLQTVAPVEIVREGDESIIIESTLGR